MRNYRPRIAYSQFLCNWARSVRRHLFRSESWVQADGTLLCTGHRVLSPCKMPVPLAFSRVSTVGYGKPVFIDPAIRRTLFVRLAAVTSITFLLLFLPFLPPFSPISRILDPITRIFPFSRGLFEDKVANFWCASNVLFKWKAWASRGFLVKMSTGLTAVGFLPTVLALLQAGFKHRPTEESCSPTSPKSTRATQTPFLPLLPYALLNSSMSFFLFSFQVHEKTILLPLLPVTLLLSGAPVDSSLYSWGVLVNNTAVFRYCVPFIIGLWRL